MFVDNVGGIRRHKQVESPLGGRWQQDGLAALVDNAHRQQPHMRELANHQVVSVAGRVVSRQHDAVDPAIDQSGRRALIADLPRDRQVDRVTDHYGLRPDLRDRQIGEGRQGNGQSLGRCHVIGLGGHFGHLLARLSRHDQNVKHSIRAIGYGNLQPALIVAAWTKSNVSCGNSPNMASLADRVLSVDR